MRMMIQKRLMNGALAVMLLVAMVVSNIVLPERAIAAGEAISAIANKSTVFSQPVAITDLSITGVSNDSVTVALQAQHGTFEFGSQEAAVTGASTSLVTIIGARDDVNATLATLTYTPTALGADAIEVNLGSNISGVIIDPVGGHAYKIVDDYLTWNDARVAAKQFVYGGVQGYLANVTSDSEDQFIVEHLTGNGWIGASDQDFEGDWKWMDGPDDEAGMSFWSGAGAINGGHAVDDAYSNWNADEPNNSSNEDCAEYIVGQGWNDLNCDSQQRNYVVEFGAADLPEPITEQFTITTAGPTTNVANCAQLMALTGDNRYDTINVTADINCAGVAAHPLIGDGDEFMGTFNGNGHTIRNVTIDAESDWNVALFAQANGATFKNVTLSNFTMNGAGRVAALVGATYGSVVIENVHATNVSLGVDASRAGGLAGQISADGASRIAGSSVDGGTITCTGAEGGCSYIGGLVGQINTYGGAALLVEESYSNVLITATNDGDMYMLGGLIGEATVDQEFVPADEPSSITLRDVYSWSTIDSPRSYYIGGLVGHAYGYSSYEQYPVTFSIQRAYAWGDLTGAGVVGGLVGGMENDGRSEFTLQNVFAMGKVVATDTVGEVYQGAIVGHGENVEEGDNLVATGIYYDQTRTTQDTAGFVDGLDSVATAVNSNDSQATYFMNNMSNAPLSTWDFDNVWVKNTSVPPTFKLFVPLDDSDDNGDGTPDRLQQNVASFTSPVNAKRVVVQLSDTCDITQASAAAESTTSGDAGYTYAGGLISFDADCTGGSTEVVLYQYGVSADDVVARKFNPGNGAYFTIDSATISTVIINGQNVVKATYTIEDNDDLDLNKTTGKISDPVGLGVLAIGVPNTGLGGRLSN